MTIPRALHIIAAVSLLSGVATALRADEQSAKFDAVPDAAALLLKVQENQKIIDQLREQYACRKNVEDLEATKDGGFRTKGSKDFEVFYLAGQEVDRLVNVLHGL